jgi:hypothetical protein
MKIINEYITHLNEQAEREIAITGLALISGFMVSRIISAFKKCNRTCSGIGVKKKICRLRCKVLTLQKMEQALQLSKKECKTAKDPSKCAAKIDAKIIKIKKRIQNLKDMVEYNTPLVNVKMVK